MRLEMRLDVVPRPGRLEEVLADKRVKIMDFLDADDLVENLESASTGDAQVAAEFDFVGGK